jgi:hypothetical protein
MQAQKEENIGEVIYRSKKTTLDKKALLKGLNSPSYPPNRPAAFTTIT